MSLPTAVQRNAEKARAMVAERNGGKPPAPTPQASDGEYLKLDESMPQTVTDASYAPVTDKALAEQKAKLESQRHIEQRDAVQGESGTYVPHALSENDASVVAPGQSEAQSETGTPSQADPVNADDPSQLPDFIEPDDWKSRFTALRMAKEARRADMERLQQENRALTAKLQDLQSKARTSDSEAPAAKHFELDDDTREALGENQSQAFDKLSQSVDDRIAQKEEADKAKAADTFQSDLGSMVPRWRDINVDPNFIAWLNQEDEVMGMRRQAMLDAFVREFDAPSVAAMFRSYASGGGNGQQRIGQQTESPEVASNRAGTGLGAEEQMVEVWDQSEIAEFYRAKSRLYQSGKLRGAKLEQVLADEARIRKAMDEGRVNMSA